MARILIVDDEPDMRQTCSRILERRGHVVKEASDGASALQMVENDAFDVMILDLRMPGIDGLSVLRESKKRGNEITTLLTTAYGTIDTALQAVREGAFDYLAKPFSMKQLEIAVDRAIAHRRLLEENRQLQQNACRVAVFRDMVATSPQMRAVLEMTQRAGASDVSVLILGETGTGKELVARAIHACSQRACGPFIAIDCVAVPENLLESEMFGYEKGAFTGANAAKRGLLELASQGTVFLDEIGDLPLTTQAKLLRVLEERQFRHVGGRELISLDIRLIAATNRKLDEMVREGRFREDLFYRLNVITVDLPPLRERRQDITPLANYFLEQRRREDPRPVDAVSNAAIMVLETYEWPGNVRELRNVIHRAYSLTESGQITPLDLPPEVLNTAHGRPRAAAGTFQEQKAVMIHEFEKNYLSKVLEDTGGNASEAARRSGMKRSAFHRLLAKYRIHTSTFRK